MLARVAPARHGFADLARYLIQGPRGTPHPDRVTWLLAHNLPDADPELAAKIMTATAKLSPRTRKPTYHAMIAWHPDEDPSPDAMQEVALQTLVMLGLDEHQALIVGHGDTAHPHLHLMINRVHPVTGRAWKTSHDYRRLDKAMQQLARDHGFDYVPGHAFSPDDTDDLPTLPRERAHHAAKRGANTSRPQWSKRQSRALGSEISSELADDLGQAATWDDLDAAIDRHGLTLAAKGQGLIVGDEASYSKFSALGLKTNPDQLERRFGESFASYRKRRPVFTVDAVDIAKAMMVLGLSDQESVRQAVRTCADARRRALPERPLKLQLAAELRQAMRGTALSRKASPTPMRPAASAATRPVAVRRDGR